MRRHSFFVWAALAKCTVNGARIAILLGSLSALFLLGAPILPPVRFGISLTPGAIP
jgi:hypothetical protein